jgi:hypothetical protein
MIVLANFNDEILSHECEILGHKTVKIKMYPTTMIKARADESLIAKDRNTNLYRGGMKT